MRGLVFLLNRLKLYTLIYLFDIVELFYTFCCSVVDVSREENKLCSWAVCSTIQYGG